MDVVQLLVLAKAIAAALLVGGIVFALNLILVAIGFAIEEHYRRRK